MRPSYIGIYTQRGFVLSLPPFYDNKKGEAPITGNLPYLLLRYGNAYCAYGMVWQSVQTFFNFRWVLCTT
jgi:hypothetical protein